MYGSIISILVLMVSSAIMLFAAFNYLDFCRSELRQTGEIIVERIRYNGFVNENEIQELLNNNQNIRINIREFILEADKDGERDYEFRKGRPVPTGFEMSSGLINRYLNYFTAVQVDGKNFGIMLDWIPERGMIRSFSILFMALNIIGITGAYFAGRYMSMKILEPIIAITDTAEAIGANDLSRRIEYEGAEDEIKILADTFNEMIDRLEVAFNKQTQFISDASHELRTPISVIQGYANLIDRWAKDDPDILQEAIDSIKSETQHMSVLIKKLLFLARNDRNDHVNKKIISLNDVANEVVKEMSVLEKNANIHFIGEENISILADYDLIKQMIWIFADNSIKYAKNENSFISISVFKDDYACISITDNGIGICDKDCLLFLKGFTEPINQEVKLYREKASVCRLLHG